jgi:hypothetical protein
MQRRRHSGLRGRWNRARSLRLGGRRFRSFRRRFLSGEIVEMFSREFRVIEIQRTGVRLFLRDADLRQEVDQHLGLDLEFPGQFVNSNLVRIGHAPLG